MKQLKITLKILIQQGKTDQLENCINGIFTNTIDTEIDIGDDNVDDGEIVEVIHDDYSYIMQQSDQDNTNSTTLISNGLVSKLGLSNIFDQGRETLVEMKIPLVQERKQNRMKRSQAFFLMCTRQ